MLNRAFLLTNSTSSKNLFMKIDAVLRIKLQALLLFCRKLHGLHRRIQMYFDPGYRGPNCTEDINECESSPCAFGEFFYLINEQYA